MSTDVSGRLLRREEADEGYNRLEAYSDFCQVRFVSKDGQRFEGSLWRDIAGSMRGLLRAVWRSRQGTMGGEPELVLDKVILHRRIRTSDASHEELSYCISAWPERPVLVMVILGEAIPDCHMPQIDDL